jgi:hypothetical protein
MTNARSIIEQAARKIHVLGRGQTLSADEAQEGLTALNNMLSMFSIEGGLVYSITKETFPLTGAQSYTIGSGGDFNTTAPVDIISLYTTLGTTDYRATPLNATEYASIETKSIVGEPNYYFYDNNRPLGRIYLYPVPNSTYTVTIYSYKAITSFSDLTTDYNLPEGVETMLVHNLAVIWAPEYEKEASPTVKSMALQSKIAVLGFNRRNNYPTSRIDGVPTGGNGYNIYTGRIE